MIHVRIVITDGFDFNIEHIFYNDLATAQAGMLRRFTLFHDAGWEEVLIDPSRHLVILRDDDLSATFQILGD